MKKIIPLFFLLFATISFANANKKATKNESKISTKNEEKLKSYDAPKMTSISKIKKESKRPPRLCSIHQYITCTNSLGEVIVLGSTEWVYWCDSGVFHHMTLIEQPEFEELCYL
ncbi:MAG TPA: hypothetical protein PLW32_07665 [Chitinophagaceae bacterium]|jgi:hypothetical protein|nr:hypothetical protein [Chitinophagaceae bacterium]MBP9739941.1 hypothetical protein [Chitinophagaceae bacterium]HPH23741.1 hypothetical protein [Chitinophagaceae bacterium]